MLTVLIPALNEEGAIAQTVEKVREALEKGGISDAEVLVIDDGSSDRTGELARAAGATVLRNPHNLGYGASLKRGIVAARHDAVCLIDADLTYPEHEIPRLYQKHREGFDMVVGARTGHHYSGSIFKGPLRQILRFCVEFAAGRRIPDANSGLRVFSRSVALEQLPHLCDTFSFTTSITIAYCLTGRFILYVPIEYHLRLGKSKVKLLKDSIRTLIYIAQTIVYYNPLKLFLLFALSCIGVAAVCFGLGVLLEIAAPYYLGIGCLLLAVLMFALGLIADLLRQIMLRTAFEPPERGT
jgi:glycosyltransferase involved in cell wall biosynthesis